MSGSLRKPVTGHYATHHGDLGCTLPPTGKTVGEGLVVACMDAAISQYKARIDELEAERKEAVELLKAYRELVHTSMDYSRIRGDEYGSAFCDRIIERINKLIGAKL